MAGTARTVVDVTVPKRVSTVIAHLARSGFTDPADAERLLADLHLETDEAEPVVAALAAAADPDLALRGLGRLVAAAADGDDLTALLRGDDGFRARLCGVL